MQYIAAIRSKRLFGSQSKQYKSPTFAIAFTLTELIIVIAIIMLLAGVSIPVFLSAKSQAKRVICANNLKIIGQGLAQYFVDYNQYPAAVQYWTPEIDVIELDIRHTLRHYCDNPDIFRCPSDLSDHNDVGWHATFGNSYCWHNSYSKLLPGATIGHLYLYYGNGDQLQYSAPLMNDVVPNHVRPGSIVTWPGQDTCSDTGWNIESWLIDNLDSFSGFNSLWPDGHVQNGLGEYAAFIEKLKQLKQLR